jgi:hypothetical protein
MQEVLRMLQREPALLRLTAGELGHRMLYLRGLGFSNKRMLSLISENPVIFLWKATCAFTHPSHFCYALINLMNGC